MTATQPARPGQAELAPTRSSADLPSRATKVVVIEAGIEIHGYMVARHGNRVRVVWAVASGRHRHRAFPNETVFRPGNTCRWDGYLISDDQLAAIGQAVR